MSASKAKASRFTRHKTRYRGITYRLRADGARQYAVYFKARYIAIEGGEQDALAKQAELRGKAARGERVITRTKATFAEVAEQWLESKRKLRKGTREGYRDALDRILIPRFGTMKLAAMTPDHIAALIRELEERELSGSMIENYLLPMTGTMKFAM